MDSLKSILGEDEFKDFIDNFFEKKHKVLKNVLDHRYLKRDREWFRLILMLAKSMPSNIRANKNGSVLEPPANTSAKILAEWAENAYINGATIVLNYVERIDLDLFEASKKIGKDIGASVTFTFFYTPSQSQGFVPHFDTLDVFIFQLVGSKKWAIAQNQISLPTTKQGYLVDKEKSIVNKSDSFCLEEGDMLYIPRGLVHWAETQENSSIHVTCDVNTVTLGQLLSWGFLEKDLNYIDQPIINNKNIFEDFIYMLEKEYESIDVLRAIESSMSENDLFK